MSSKLVTTNLSYHGVARIELGKISEHSVSDGQRDRTWQAITIWFYDKYGEEAESIQVHSPEDVPLRIVSLWEEPDPV